MGLDRRAYDNTELLINDNKRINQEYVQIIKRQQELVCNNNIKRTESERTHYCKIELPT